MDINKLRGEYIAENFKVVSGNAMIEVLKRENEIYDLGFHERDSVESLLENPNKIVISDMTLEELVHLKDSIVILINRIEKDSTK